MKNALRLALLLGVALSGGVSVCGAAQQAPAPPLDRFTVLRTVHVLGPTIEMTGAQANCAVSGSSDNATVKCRPIGVTQKSAYTYNVTLIAQADGTAYVIACRIGLISNLWCKSLAEGRILRGNIANGHLMVPDGSVSHDYIVLNTAQIGPLDTDEPAVAAAPVKKGRTAPQAAAQPAPAPQQQSQAASAPAKPAPSAAPPYPTLGDLPAACVSSSAAAGASDSACVSFASDPSGADIYVDGKFVGNTPSLMPLTAGSHDIRIEAAQRKPWTRTLQATEAGRITIHANLDPADK